MEYWQTFLDRVGKKALTGIKGKEVSEGLFKWYVIIHMVVKYKLTISLTVFKIEY